MKSASLLFSDVMLSKNSQTEGTSDCKVKQKKKLSQT